jgi:hypothetical protein
VRQTQEYVGGKSVTEISQQNGRLTVTVLFNLYVAVDQKSAVPTVTSLSSVCVLLQGYIYIYIHFSFHTL